MTFDPITHGLAFVLGWAACVGFQWLAAIVLDFAAARMAINDNSPTTKRNAPCPWPCDDEAERAVRHGDQHPWMER